MAEVNSVFFTLDGDRFKLINKVVLGLALLSSIWEPDVSGAIAVLGILAVVCGNMELLFTYILLNPFSVIWDIIRLIIRNNVGVIIIDVAEIIMKLAGFWVAWSLWSRRAQGNYQPYIGQDGGAHSGGQTSQDPFASYKPQDTNQA
eukprot:TRINITY_DN2207_c0_g2_i1.p2 TRINITY_DN2207_c0_g2~~TRINITY_DN2207_c0_g2_i1.p2  ORF type:complete len:158 (+),score=7.12 TRINITY_DN2207_c0_g2_i1:39-476(+)